jgi:DNA-binding HxlR family transcriptional regulator
MATKPTTLSSTMAQSPASGQICPRYEQAIQLLGKRWTGLLIYALLEGPQRFCELTNTVEGLSDRVLSDRLRELEVEGIVKRVVYPQIPVRVEYELTYKGRALESVVAAIRQWAEQWVTLAEDTFSAELVEASQ